MNARQKAKKLKQDLEREKESKRYRVIKTTLPTRQYRARVKLERPLLDLAGFGDLPPERKDRFIRNELAGQMYNMLVENINYELYKKDFDGEIYETEIFIAFGRNEGYEQHLIGGGLLV